MLIERLTARSFRSYEALDVNLGRRVTVVTGDNGAGKTNLLEALYFGCVGRSCRTRVENQVIRFGDAVARVEVECLATDESGESSPRRHTLATAIERSGGKTFFADGANVTSLEGFGRRPPVAVFMPDRLELVKGAPGVRRAHIDQVVAALWPARRANRRAYADALAQRNALLARGGGSAQQLDVWDRELARTGLALVRDRAVTVDELTTRFQETALAIGLTGDAGLRYRPSAAIADENEFTAQLARRREQDLARGFSGLGPHRDEIVLSLDERELRTYGSQGQQRLALLALLLAECQAIATIARRPPLILLDDVMSELDATRRSLLVDRVAGLGQVLITATERDHVPLDAPVDAEVSVAAGAATALFIAG